MTLCKNVPGSFGFLAGAEVGLGQEHPGKTVEVEVDTVQEGPRMFSAGDSLTK